jgi:hypothetical protein
MIHAELTTGRAVAGEPTELTVALRNDSGGTCTNLVFSVHLPRQLTLLRGDERIEASRVRPGEAVIRTLRVRASAAGRFPVTSDNFSYRDPTGAPVRVSDFESWLTVADATVTAPVQRPRPELDVELHTTALPYGEWTTLRGTVTNTGRPDLVDVTVTAAGPFTVDTRGAPRPGTIAAGRSAEFSLFVRPSQRGAQVPLHVDVAFGDGSGQRLHRQRTIPVRVDVPATDAPTGPTAAGPGHVEPVRILYLSANPSEQARLRVDEELREIRDALQRSPGGLARFDLQQRTALRERDLSLSMLETRPRIVHFSGHGSAGGGIYIEDDIGRQILISVGGLAELFRLMSASVECVIVNACDTRHLAEAIVEHVDHVVGMRQKIGDRAAIRFSTGFYQALGAGEPVDRAFEFGCAQIRFSPIGSEHSTPVLLRRSAVGAHD